MVVGALGGRTEVAIIGAGPGGYVAALRAADAGLDVTLIDRAELGGTCLNVGCIPSKALIELANVRHHAVRAAAVGLDAQVQVRGGAVADHLASVSGRLRTGVGSLLAAAGVTVLHGDASVVRYDRLSVAHQDQVTNLEFDNLILATGSRPRSLPGVPFGDRIVSSTGALQLDRIPQTMAVVGGGYIGIELGTAWSKLGVSVTVVEAAPSILPETPRPLRAPVERALQDLNIGVHLNSRAKQPTIDGLELEDGTQLAADIIVVAVGRRPNSDQASLTSLDIELLPSGHIKVDDQMRATRGVYAIGDLVTGPALAHKASAEAEVAIDALLHRPTVAVGSIPAVIFSDPEIMTVGVGLDEARERGLAVHRFPHGASARAQTLTSPTGSTYLVTDSGGTVLGVHAVGPHASELAGEAALAVELAATVEDVSMTVHPHPTMSETLAEAAWLARGMPLHMRP